MRLLEATREFAMGAGEVKATEPWTQKTAPSIDVAARSLTSIIA
jgi:hypothetical protein